jgi:hypothetical protein
MSPRPRPHSGPYTHYSSQPGAVEPSRILLPADTDLTGSLYFQAGHILY